MTKRVRADDRIVDVDERSVGMSLPVPISDRLDELVSLVDDAGDRTSRKELVAALVLAARTGGEDLSELVRWYRRALVRDALLSPETAPDQILIAERRPGPRRRRTSPGGEEH